MRISTEEYRHLVARTRAAPNVSAPKRAATTRKERDIQRAILDAAKLWKGVRLWKTGGGLLPLADGRRVRMGVVGVSDLIGWTSINASCQVTARFVALEVKRPGQYPTREQQAFLDAVRAAGGIGAVVRSVDDVRRALAATVISEGRKEITKDLRALDDTIERLSRLGRAGPEDAG